MTEARPATVPDLGSETEEDLCFPAGWPEDDAALARPLPPAEAVMGTPALAAIEAGLGQYLLSVGFVAEHPLFYVWESQNLHVYVRFDVSADGLGFLDTTYVYSPQVCFELKAIFDRFDAFLEGESRQPHTSERTMLGRPVHASIQSLWASVPAYRSRRIFGADALRAARRAEPWMSIKGMLRRRRARLWMKKTGRAPRFGSEPEFGVNLNGPEFAALPLNYDPGVARVWTNWRADPDPAHAGAASLAHWRTYVERKLPHATRLGPYRERVEVRTHPNSIYLPPQPCEFGFEWQFYDQLYWTMMSDYEFDWSPIMPVPSNGVPQCDKNLYYEAREYELWLLGAFGARIWPGRFDRAELQDPSAVLELVLAEADVRPARSMFHKQAAIFASRHGAPIGSGRWDHRDAAYYGSMMAYVRSEMLDCIEKYA